MEVGINWLLLFWPDNFSSFYIIEKWELPCLAGINQPTGVFIVESLLTICSIPQDCFSPRWCYAISCVLIDVEVLSTYFLLAQLQCETHEYLPHLSVLFWVVVRTDFLSWYKASNLRFCAYLPSKQFTTATTKLFGRKQIPSLLVKEPHFRKQSRANWILYAIGNFPFFPV